MQSRSWPCIAHAGPGRDGLLAEAVVEGARDLALAVEHHRPLLDAAHREHRAQEAGAVVQRQVLARFACQRAARPRARLRRRHAVGCPIPFLVRAIRDPPARPMVLAARAGSPPRVLPCPGQGYPPRGGSTRSGSGRARALAAARRVALAGFFALAPLARRRRCSRALPPYDGAPPGLIGCVLLAGFANLFLVAVVAPLAGRRCAAAGPTCRARSRRTTPARTLIARAHGRAAGARARCTGPRSADHRDDDRAVVDAVGGYVATTAPGWAPGLAALDARELAPDVYRACVPGATRAAGCA